MKAKSVDHTGGLYIATFLLITALDMWLVYQLYQALMGD